MSTIDFSDFDRSIHELFQSLENLKDSPDEASKKIDAFLKKNQEFLAAHKKNPFVEMQLNSLAGRVKEIFPESQKVQGWADFIQTIFKSPVKILEPEEVLAEIEDLKKSISTARGTIMSPGLAARLKAFAENPRIWDFLVAYGKNPTIGRQLLELGISLKQFTDDPEALKLAQDLIELAKDMQLPDELLIDTLKFLPPRDHKDLPKEWEHLSLDAKIEWLNLHDGDIETLGFTAFDDRFLSFLKEHGKKLRCLTITRIRMTPESVNQMLQHCPNLRCLTINRIRSMTPEFVNQMLQHYPKIEWFNFPDGDIKTLGFTAFDDRFLNFLKKHGSKLRCLRITQFFETRGMTTESLNQMLQYCPNLERIYLDLPSGEDFIISTLPRKLKVLRLSGNVTSLPFLPETLISFGLINSSIVNLPALPQGLKSIHLEMLPELELLPSFPTTVQIIRLEYLNWERLPSFPESTKFVRLTSLNELHDLPPLPTGLVGLSLNHLTLGRLPHLEEGLLFLRLRHSYLETRFNIPTSLKFVEWFEMDTPGIFEALDFQYDLVKKCQVNVMAQTDDLEREFLESYGLVAFNYFG